MITQERLMEILQDLPQVHLELVDLAWKLIGEDGKLDFQKISFHYLEMEKAVGEAEAYAKATKGMVQCLISLLR
jgi:hypothetical protein